MPGRLSGPTREAIRRLYREGMSRSAIARELGVDRGTVARYANEVDAGIAVADAPAAAFTEREVAVLKGLATRETPLDDDVRVLRGLFAMAAWHLCAACETRYVFLKQWDPESKSTLCFCPACGESPELKA